MELPKGQVSGKEFWLSHIKAAEDFEGTNKEYCQKHGLNAGSFSAYRKKLGFSRPRKKKISRFSDVKINDASPKKSIGKLPDPKWLAEFLKAWEA